MIFQRKSSNYLNKEIDFEEVFLEGFLKKQGSNSDVLQQKIEFPLRDKSFRIFSVVSLLVLFLIWINCFILQVIDHREYKEKSQANNFITSKIESERGVIYDRNMQQLVFNDVRFDVFISKKDLPEDKLERDEVLLRTAEVLGVEVKKIEEELAQSPDNLIKIAQDIGHKPLVLLESESGRFPGIVIRKRIKREYKSGKKMSHLLGYTGEISKEDFKRFSRDYEMGDYVGKEGIEKQYQDVLAEHKGVFEIERDALGREIKRILKKPPTSGDSIVLTIDYSFQEKLYEALEKRIKEYEASGGAAVAINPKNGEVLALVSLPSFDNNMFARGISEQELRRLNQDRNTPQLNRVIGGVYPTGSVIKPILAVAALEEGIITEKTTLYCPERLCVENKYTKEKRCFADWKFHGWSDVKRAIAESVNPFFYIIGGGYLAPSFADPRLPRNFKGLGVERIKNYLKLFGWGENTGIDLPGEVKGRVPDPDWKKSYFSKPVNQKWYLGDTYNLSIGQGFLLITPLQVAVAFSALANNGTLFQPRLLKAVLDGKTGKVIKEGVSKIIRDNFVKKENILIAKEGMRQAVSSPVGSAHLLNNLPVKVAAKTGTAQKGIQEDIFYNWIVVMAPYEDPELVLVVLVENVKGLHPVTQQIAYDALNWYFGEREEEE